MITTLIILVALLYILGRYQGAALADMLNAFIAQEGYEIDKRGRFMLTWGWPVAAVVAMIVGDASPEELG